MSYALVETVAQLDGLRVELRNAIREGVSVGFDVETHGPNFEHPKRRRHGRPVSRPDATRHRVVGYGVSIGADSWYVPLRNDASWWRGGVPCAPASDPMFAARHKLLNFATIPAARVVVHNWPYELQVLRNEGVDARCVKLDSLAGAWMRGMRLPDPAGLKLKPLMAHYFNAVRPGFEDVVRGRLVYEVPSDELGPYCAADAADAVRLWEQCWREMSEDERRVYLEDEQPMFRIVADMMAAGVPIDAGGLAAGAERACLRMEECAAEFEALTRTTVQLPAKARRPKRCGGPAHVGAVLPGSAASHCYIPGCVSGILHFKNGKQKSEVVMVTAPVLRGAEIGSSQQVSRWLVDELGWWPDTLPMCKDGRHHSTSAEDIQPLTSLPGNPGKAAALRLEYQGLSKYADLYTLGNIAMAAQSSDGRLHTSYALCGTETTRLSSSFPNLANIPRTPPWAAAPNVRAMFPAPDGWAWVVYDLNQFEMRAMAHYSRDPELLRVYREGADVHALTMARLGIPRPPAKIVNFSTIYRIGPRSLAAKIAFATRAPYSEERARADIDGFYESYPGVADYHERAIRYARTHGYVRLLNGHRIPLPGPWTGRQRWAAENRAINYPIQGCNAVVLKRALRRLHARWDMRGWLGEYAQISMQVYDEIGCLVRLDKVELAGQDIKWALEGAAPELLVPVVAEGGVGATFAAAKGKG